MDIDVRSLGRVGAPGGLDAVYLPVDGEYRIEAGSMLDDLEGGYTLTLESRRVEVDPAILQSYAGRYLMGEAVRTVFVEGGRLYSRTGAQTSVLDPISETEFIQNPAGARLVFRNDDDGSVTGFDWVSTHTPASRQSGLRSELATTDLVRSKDSSRFLTSVSRLSGSRSKLAAFRLAIVTISVTFLFIHNKPSDGTAGSQRIRS